jgi:outer membrane receptor protein involved in Fe transport
MKIKAKTIAHLNFMMFSLLLFVVDISFSQTRGLIRGKVLDSKTDEGLPGANVVIKGTYYGASTDIDGNFIIQNVSPGQYTLEVSMIGYTITQQTGVKVIPGQDAELTIKLEETVLAIGQEVVIIGERPLFSLDETSTRRAVTADELKTQVVESAEDVVANQVGVVKTDNEIHIRGSRSYESAFLVDGVSVQDPLAGTGFGLKLSTSAIHEMEVLTGGFNAEYGQAMSGVINVSTKDGGDVYNGFLSYKNDYFGLNSDKLSTSFNTDIVEFTLSGPEPLTKLLSLAGLNLGEFSFFANGYMQIFNDYTKRHAKQLYSSTFYGTRFAPRQFNEWYGIIKLTWKPNSTNKFKLSANGSVSINQNTQSLQTNLEYVAPGPGYPYEFEKNLDNFNVFTHRNDQISLSWVRTLSSKAFFEVKASRFFTNLRSDANGKSWEKYSKPVDLVKPPFIYKYKTDTTRAQDGTIIRIDTVSVNVAQGDGFYDVGNGFTWHDHFSEEYTVKADITYHYSNEHKFKAGLEHTYKHIQLVDIYQPWIKPFGQNNDMYIVYPSVGSGYIQDNITFSGLILNLGVRLDYWAPGKYVEDAIDNENLDTITDETRKRFEEDTFGIFGSRVKARLSPRIGISHPISDNQMLFFSYGHFSKWPRPQFIYAKLNPRSAKTDYPRYGNPNLNAETTVAYELGLKNKFTENDVLTVTLYYKDIFDYVTTLNAIGTKGRYAGSSFTTYANLDYSRSRGIELEYKKRTGKYFSGSINTSFSIATGKSSTPDDNALVAQGRLPEKPIKEVFLIWDRPFQGSLNMNFSVPKKQGLDFPVLRYFDDWNLSARWFMQSGKRYTPYLIIRSSSGKVDYLEDRDNPYNKIGEGVSLSKLFTNFNGKNLKKYFRSYWSWVDFNFEKYFKFYGLNFTFSIEVLNLFNWKNSNIINPITGRAYQYGDPVPIDWNDPLNPDFQAPVKPFPDNPARYLTSRNIKAGLSVEF